MTPTIARLATCTAALAGLFVFLGPADVWAAGPGVHGRVLGHDEQGELLGVVAAAKIEFQNRSGARVAATAADKNGYYKVDLPPGEYLYTIEAPGYRKEEAGRGMRLEQSEGYAIFNLAITKGETDPNRKPPVLPSQKLGKLRGRVLEKTPSGTVGIPDARIALRREGSRELISVRSRAATEGQKQIGEYEVTLEAGTYRASAMAAGYETFTDPDAIEIKPGAEAKRDFVLSRPVAEENKDQGIRGVVTVIDSGATPPPIKIQIVPLATARPTPIDVQPASNGAYAQDLPAGRYRVMATAEGFPSASSPPVFVFEGRYTLVNLVLRAERVPEPKTTVEAFVFTAPKEGTVVPLSGATVALLKTGADPLAAKEATTDATGHAIFAVTEAGEYVAEAHLKGYRAGSGKGAVQLGQSHEIGIELVKETAPPAELLLSVVVTDATTKKPLAGAKILARHAEQTLAEAARATTDAKGEAALRVTRPGNYTVLAQHFGYEPGGAKSEVAAQRVNRLALSLKPVSSPADQREPVKPPEDQKPPVDDREAKPLIISGYVAYREVTGQLRSVPDAKLVWERVIPTKPSVTEFAVTGRSGRYQIEVSAGTYQVRVEPPAGFEEVLERVQVDPSTQEKYFIVRRSEREPAPPTSDLVSVKGLVVAEASGGRYVGVPGAEILFVRSAGVAKSESGTGGEFGIQLPAEAYRVYVRAKGFESLESRAEIRSGMMPLRYVLKRSEEPLTGFSLTVNVVERARTAVAALMRPVAGAQVQVSLEGRLLPSGATSSSGQYSARVKPGSYTVRVVKPGYSPATLDVPVSNRNVTQQIVLTREEGREPEPAHKPTLTVRVARHVERPPMTIKPIGSAISGAQVTVMSGSKPVATGTTGAAGTYTVQLAPGNYSVKVEAQSFAPAGKVTTLSERDVYLDFQLDSRGSETIAPRRDDVRRLVPGFDPSRATRSELKEKASYVVEYHLSDRLPWTELGRYQSNQDAQRALVQAISRRQIPKTAQTRIRVEK